MQMAFADISSALDYSINFELSLDTMPLSSQDAISYAALIPLCKHIEELGKGKKIIVTGGDAEKLMRLIDALEDLDDVQEVHFNAIFPDDFEG